MERVVDRHFVRDAGNQLIWRNASPEGTDLPRSSIIQAIVDDEITLSQSLSHLQVIAHDLENHELEAWAESENVGYPAESDVPEYRHATSINFLYTGINMSHEVKKAPLNPAFLGTDVVEEIADVPFRQGVSALEGFLDNAGSSVLLDRSLFVDVVDRNSNGGIQCFAIGQVIPKSFFQNALSEIKNRIIKALLLLEEEFGCLDDIGIDDHHRKSRVQRVNNQINSGVLHIQVDPPSTPIGEKISWNIIVPTITGIIGTIGGILFQHFTGI